MPREIETTIVTLNGIDVMLTPNAKRNATQEWTAQIVVTDHAAAAHVLGLADAIGNAVAYAFAKATKQ